MFKLIKKIKLNCILSIIVFLIGIFGLIDNFFTLELLKNVSPDFFAIHPAAALMLILSGSLLFFINNGFLVKRKMKNSVVSFFVFSIFFIIFNFSFESFQNMFFHLKSNLISPPVTGHLCFLLIALRGFLFLFDSNRSNFVKLMGWIIFVISSISLFGYLADIPVLYYKIPDRYPVALLTAIGLFLSSIVLIKNEPSKSKKINKSYFQ